VNNDTFAKIQNVKTSWLALHKQWLQIARQNPNDYRLEILSSIMNRLMFIDDHLQNEIIDRREYEETYRI